MVRRIGLAAYVARRFELTVSAARELLGGYFGAAGGWDPLTLSVEFAGAFGARGGTAGVVDLSGFAHLFEAGGPFQEPLWEFFDEAAPGRYWAGPCIATGTHPLSGQRYSILQAIHHSQGAEVWVRHPLTGERFPIVARVRPFLDSGDPRAWFNIGFAGNGPPMREATLIFVEGDLTAADPALTWPLATGRGDPPTEFSNDFPPYLAFMLDWEGGELGPHHKRAVPVEWEPKVPINEQDVTYRRDPPPGGTETFAGASSSLVAVPTPGGWASAGVLSHAEAPDLHPGYSVSLHALVWALAYILFDYATDGRGYTPEGVLAAYPDAHNPGENRPDPPVAWWTWVILPLSGTLGAAGGWAGALAVGGIVEPAAPAPLFEVRPGATLTLAAGASIQIAA